MNKPVQNNPVTVPEILSRKASKDASKKKIAAVTAYDYTSARLIDQTDIDVILVGDSLACVIQGQSTTLPVTLEEIIYHSKCVVKGCNRALTVGDLPFLSYQISTEKAIESAGRLLKESGVGSVKLEGGIHIAPTIEQLVKYDIPVMAHIGLTPQSFHRMGGHKVQGRKHDAEKLAAGTHERLIEDALAVEAAGAYAVVIECVPSALAEIITDRLSIPTIGIGAGPACDGQILVLHDMLGLEERRKPKFVKRYANMAGLVKESLQQYVSEVQSGSFPSEEHSFKEDSAGVAERKRRLQLV